MSFWIWIRHKLAHLRHFDMRCIWHDSFLCVHTSYWFVTVLRTLCFCTCYTSLSQTVWCNMNALALVLHFLRSLTFLTCCWRRINLATIQRTRCNVGANWSSVREAGSTARHLWRQAASFPLFLTTFLSSDFNSEVMRDVCQTKLSSCGMKVDFCCLFPLQLQRTGDTASKTSMPSWNCESKMFASTLGDICHHLSGRRNEGKPKTERWKERKNENWKFLASMWDTKMQPSFLYLLF